MQPYVYEGRSVLAMQWLGQAIEGVQVETRTWGIIGKVETATGPQWISEGDWLVDEGGSRSIVSPAIFTDAVRAPDH